MSTALSNAALAQSSMALSRAKDAECRAIMPAYNAQTATVEQTQEYARCVERLHPDAMSAEMVLFVKVSIVTAFAGAAIGAWLLGRRSYDPWIDTMLGGLFGLLVGSVLPAAVVGSVIAVGFLFT